MCGKMHIFIITALAILDHAKGLVELPTVEDNDIVRAEAITRNTTNSLFSMLRLTKIREKPRLKQYSAVHNFFVSLTLQDYHSLKEIARLTRVDKTNIENVTADFIVLLNDILNEDNMETLQALIKGNEIEGGYNLNEEMQKIAYLKNNYVDSDKILDINGKILQLLNKAETNKLRNETAQSESLLDTDELILEENATWHDSDEEKKSGRRIYQGHRTKIKRFPFMASVQIFNKFQCACSIITHDLVITAASCLQLAWNNRFYRENPQFLSVRVGSSFYESGGDNIAVLEVYFYPTYTPKTLRNNLAIMRLHRRVRWKSRVKKIMVDKEASALASNTDGITVIGWGARTASNVLHGAWQDKLGFAVIDFYPLRDCQEVYSKEYVTKTNFCAGFISVGGGACNRDVGGPGVAGGILVGVISFGAPVCGTPDAPTVFTKVGFYYDWIEQIMDQEVPNINKRTTLKPIRYNHSEPIFQHEWTVTPVSTIAANRLAKIAPNTGATTSGSNLLRNLDKDLFREFLKTMFDSEEIDEYLDTMVNKTSTTNAYKPMKKPSPPPQAKREHVTSLDEEVYTIPATRMAEDLDPVKSSIEKDSEEINLDGVVESVTHLSIDFDEPTGEDTVKATEVAETSETTPTTPTTAMLQVSTPVPTLDSQDIALENKLREIMEQSHINISSDSPLRAEIEGIDDNNKLDEAILTLLYLTDNETESKGVKASLRGNDYEVAKATEGIQFDLDAQHKPKYQKRMETKDILDDSDADDESFLDMLRKVIDSNEESSTPGAFFK